MGKELTEAPFDYGIFGSLFRFFLWRNEIKWMSWVAVFALGCPGILWSPLGATGLLQHP